VLFAHILGGMLFREAFKLPVLFFTVALGQGKRYYFRHVEMKIS
jgi:hypothetical protein